MRKIGAAERRHRLGVRHRLSARSGDPADVARDLVGLHSSDPATVFLSLRARTRDIRPADIEAALYTDRSVARVLGMRRTMFVVPRSSVPTIHAAAARALAPGERARTVKMLQEAGIAADAEAWLDTVAEATLAALETRGEATASELSEDVTELRTQIPVGAGKKWAGTIGVSTRVLFLLATEAKIVRGRPRGGWTSTQYRWAPVRSWLGVDVDQMPTPVARTELARSWLERFGPGTVSDLKWWTGWTVANTKRALDEVGAVEVDLDGAGGGALPDDLDEVEPPEPWVAFLPALDPTVMGWPQRDWFLGPHRPPLFDRNGNAGPTVWWNGRIVGGWAQRRDGEIAFRLLEDIGSDAETEVEREAERVADWLGDVRFVPRFRTPLERELSA